jgi:hypothetical protein
MAGQNWNFGRELQFCFACNVADSTDKHDVGFLEVICLKAK